MWWGCVGRVGRRAVFASVFVCLHVFARLLLKTKRGHVCAMYKVSIKKTRGSQTEVRVLLNTFFSPPLLFSQRVRGSFISLLTFIQRFVPDSRDSRVSLLQDLMVLSVCNSLCT